ncbi:hypothetical protein N7474_006622 [Penicillium riverlandense]|uniref:uncharacterized protein n=1 Tax=Penicillium riverlandense TaxID=1903569 RepID=UPI0025472F32|nr:uncharacterized protein N7474_006622 [Penicillium riverlandense]KAJ5814845.1 hypothetical protein N7474_006622 [Penicillium riverlandense]
MIVGETDPGYIFIGVRKYNEAGTAPTIFDNNGDMVWQGPQGENLDFKVQKLFGQDVITYWDGQPGDMVLGYGATHILDNTYKEIYTVTLHDDFQTADGTKFDSYIDGHEHYITPDNTMLVSAVNFTKTNTSHLHNGLSTSTSATQGSFQLLPCSGTEHMLLGYGSIPKLKEYDRDGNVVLRGQFGNSTYAANAYRISKSPWRATPHWDPVLFVNHRTEHTTDVYMSWNGATEYDNWAIFSVPSETSTFQEDQRLLNHERNGFQISCERLLVHERNGFETHVPLENVDAKFIIAVARDGEKVLGKSFIMEFAS